mgnify:CR=1 FL=1
MSKTTLPMEVRLDADGFVRRQCPRCRRQWKWLASSFQQGPVPTHIYCPYCGHAAPPDQWWTRAQIEYAKALVMSDVMGPALERLARNWKRLNRPGSLVRFESSYRNPRRPTPPAEPNDMRKAVPPCHPEKPVKVLEDWHGALHCPACGQRFETAGL